MSRREVECGSKVAFRYREYAEHAIEGFGERIAEGRMSAYHCRWGDHWHIGHRGTGTNGRAGRPRRRAGRRGRFER